MRKKYLQLDRGLDLLDAALKKKVFTRAELLVCQNGNKILHQNVGAPKPAIYFDLASLTKPLCTALVTLKLEEKKLLKISDKIERFYPTHNLKGVTIKNLLNHTSGLIDWVDFTKLCTDPAGLLPLILNDRTLAPHKMGQTIYSDLGYILLGKILEKITGKNLEALFTQEISSKLKISRELFFNTPNKFEKKIFVPTEKTPVRGLVRGDVMDDNAHFMQGIAGHAGLFGTATAIHKILMELRKGILGQSKFFTKPLCKKYLSPAKNRNLSKRIFTLGFDTPTAPNSQSGRFFSSQSIGHLGYAGTSFWWDLKNDFWIILLTNRCYPSRKNKKLSKLRPMLHDEIIKRISLIK